MTVEFEADDDDEAESLGRRLARRDPTRPLPDVYRPLAIVRAVTTWEPVWPPMPSPKPDATEEKQP